MMCISSPAGRRLAAAKARLDGLNDRSPADDELASALDDFEAAAEAVADELIAQRFHEMEGD